MLPNCINASKSGTEKKEWKSKKATEPEHRKMRANCNMFPLIAKKNNKKAS